MDEKYINPDSDGKFYVLNELVRTNCQDCIGCSKCCHDMGESILIDPYDVWQIEKETGNEFNKLLQDGFFELKIVDGLILPYLKMSDKQNCCPFLNREERCRIHNCRPGLCRLFPLGRNFEDGTINYILLNSACDRKNRSKIKVSDWIGLNQPEKYQEFVIKWHYFKKNMIDMLTDADENQRKSTTLYLINYFYLCNWKEVNDFYKEFGNKIKYLEQIFQFENIK